MKENIYIELNEDVQSVIQKIRESESETLDLVIPTGARVLQNIVDAHLLKEAGDEYEKRLTVVTSDLMGRIFAERAGLTVLTQNEFDESDVVATQTVSTGRISDIVPKRRGVPIRKTVQPAAVRPGKSKSSKAQTQKTGSRKSISPEFSPKSKGEIGASFLKSYREERSKDSVFRELSHINRRRWNLPFRMSLSVFVGGVVVLTFAVGVIVLGKTLPKAEVVLYPSREAASETVNVLISSSNAKADFEKGIIPGEILTMEKFESGDFPASGSKNITDKATGKIMVYNAYSAQALNFVASRFQSENGKIFWATKSFSIPGMSGNTPGQVEIGVMAAETGESYAVGPGKFTMPALKGTARGEKVYGVSTASMILPKAEGGEKIVSSEDINNALDSLKEKVRPQLQVLRQNLPTGFQLWPEAYNEELAETSSNFEAGESTDKFTANVKMVARAVVFKNDDLENYVNQEISKNLPEDKILLAGSKEISFAKPPVIDYAKGSIQASLNVKYDAIDNLDSDEFKNAVLNKGEKDIKRIMAVYSNIERVEVKMSPFWVGSVPSNPDRVKITIVGL